MDALTQVEVMAGNASAQSLGQQRSVSARRLFGDDEKLLDPPSNDGIGISQLFRQNARQLLKHCIASRVPIFIIHCFEMVHIDHHQDDIAIIPIRASTALFERYSLAPNLG